MLFGDCQKCGAKLLPIKDGQLIQHMGSSRPCDWSFPINKREGFDHPYVTNPHLSMFDNFMIMLDILEEKNYAPFKLASKNSRFASPARALTDS